MEIGGSSVEGQQPAVAIAVATGLASRRPNWSLPSLPPGLSPDDDAPLFAMSSRQPCTQWWAVP